MSKTTIEWDKGNILLLYVQNSRFQYSFLFNYDLRMMKMN